MCLELTAPTQSELFVRQSYSRRLIDELATDLIDDRLGPVTTCERAPRATGESGQFHRYVTRVQATNRFSDTGDSFRTSFGSTGRTPRMARIRAIGEAIERYALSLCNFDLLRSGRPSDVNFLTLDPIDLLAFTDKQLTDRNLSCDELNNNECHWVPTRAMNSDDIVFVPAQFIYLPFYLETPVRQPVSTGAAAGIDRLSAFYRGLCEIIARECFIVGYLNQVSFPRLNLTGIDAPHVTDLKAELEQMGWTVHLFEATLDQPIVTCLSVGINSDASPTISIGLDADIDGIQAAYNAIRETYQFVTSTGDRTSNESPPERPLRTLAEREQFWDDPARLSELSFWLESERTTTPENSEKTLRQGVETILSFLSDQDIECYVADVTSPDVLSAGFRVLKTVVPGLHPLNLDEEFRYLGTDRLYQLPIKTGFRDESLSPHELTDTPHPFI